MGFTALLIKMDIQTELQKIHHHFGVAEKANYEIQKLFDKSIKEAVDEALRKHTVLQQKEQLITFLEWYWKKVDGRPFDARATDIVENYGV